jgi:hypothetical protein
MSAEPLSEIPDGVKVVLRENIGKFAAGMFQKCIQNDSRSSLCMNTGDYA